jgi:hypothetical protein
MHVRSKKKGWFIYALVLLFSGCNNDRLGSTQCDLHLRPGANQALQMNQRLQNGPCRVIYLVTL